MDGLVSERVPHLHICITCRAGQALDEGDTPPGQQLFDAVSCLLGERGPVRLQPVSCLASCERGCAAVISAPGKWGYLLGGLSDAVAPDLLTYAGAYAASKTGTVMPSKRPPSLLSVVLGRFPPQETL
jgi:predicted metal-binding protein